MPEQQDELANKSVARCGFLRSNGVQCEEPAMDGSAFCFWHDASVPKSSPDVRDELLRRTSNNVDMEGYQLAGTSLANLDLSGTKLINANLDGADLYKSRLMGASMFGASMRHASLFKANLSAANLKCADLEGANLLGARLEKTALDGVNWGPSDKVQNEKDADRAAWEGGFEESRKKYQEASEIYHAILNNYRERGLLTEAGDFFHREMVMRRKVLPRYSLARLGSWIIDMVCGYGEKPLRVVTSSLVILVLYGAIYSMVGVTMDGGFHSIFSDFSGHPHPFLEQAKVLANCLYLSVITLTTVGFGDVLPSPEARGFAATEAFIGAFMMALFVLVFSRKMMR